MRGEGLRDVVALCQRVVVKKEPETVDLTGDDALSGAGTPGEGREVALALTGLSAGLMCQIRGGLLVDPVVIPTTGQTYEREALGEVRCAAAEGRAGPGVPDDEDRSCR